MNRLTFFSQERNILINFYQKFIVYKIPLYNDTIRNIVDVQLINNEIVITFCKTSRALETASIAEAKRRRQAQEQLR